MSARSSFPRNRRLGFSEQREEFHAPGRRPHNKPVARLPVEWRRSEHGGERDSDAAVGGGKKNNKEQ